MGREFRTTLSSANFAVNCVEGNAGQLCALFPGMSLRTAEAVLAEASRCGRIDNRLLVPDSMVFD